nr:class I SAM-dependent methyltransferase [Burkholderiaceae bacterium]
MNPPAQLHWLENGIEQSVRWRSESGALPPRRVVLADDTMGADAAYRLACEGTALLWRGDFHNARQMLQALARRADRKPRRPARASVAGAEAPSTPAQAFHLHRQAQAQRARVLGMLIIPLAADYSVPLRRAPDFRDACTEAWDADARTARDGEASAVSLRELSGVVGAHEWRKKGVEVAALGGPGHNRIHPHYGVFSPVRGEYVQLVAQAPLPSNTLAFDVGVGTGVLSAVLAHRGVQRVVATDQDPRALACARDNLQRLGLQERVEVVQADLFPTLALYGQAPLIVCNPPWVPARASTPVEHAVYDPDSRMLRGFLDGLA